MEWTLNHKTLNINELTPDSLGPNEEQRQIADAILQWHNSNEFTFQTSGSTGTPKPITFTKDDVLASINQSQNAFSLDDNDTALISLPMKYVAGKMMLFRALHIGMNVITVAPKMNLDIDYDQPVSFAAMIPMQVENILKSKKGRTWIESIRVLLIGGGPISKHLENALEAFQNDIYHTYGMTETLTHVAIRKLSYPNTPNYTTLPNIKISKSDKDTLIINAHHLNTEIITNDVVDIISNSDFQILGRADNVINSGGLKIFPEEIESIYKEYIDQEVVITSMKDEQLGEKVIAVIEATGKLDREWINLAISKIPKAKRPKSYFYIDNLPRTESGKTRRKEVNSLILKFT